MASSIFERGRRRSIVARARVAATAAAVALACTGPARAEDPRSNETVRAAARVKLVEGVDALRRGEHRAALDRFQEAYALVPSPKIHYDFGLAYVGLGRRAEALSAFERFLAEAHDAPADKRESATRQATALRPQVGAVDIAVKGAPDGTAVAVDGREVGRSPSVRSVYLDPGPHELTVRLSGGAPGPVRRIEVRVGASVEVVLSVDGAGPAVAGVAAAGVGPSLPPSAPPAGAADGQAPVAVAGSSLASTGPVGRQADTRRIAALSLGAAGVVLIGAGVTFGLLAKSESDSLSQDSANGATPGMTPPRFDPEKESRGMRYETLQVISLAAGAVGLAAGIVLYATTRGRVTVEPVAARSHAGAHLQVSF